MSSAVIASTGASTGPRVSRQSSASSSWYSSAEFSSAMQRRIGRDSVHDADLRRPSNFVEARRIEQYLHVPPR